MGLPMACAALTFVYNEAVNLPIWINYYGNQFGYANLFVIDRSSDDNSTKNLGDVNVIRIPRDEFDEHSKTNLMSSFHSGLTAIYDAVVTTDCDEIVVADPAFYKGLPDYISNMKTDYSNGLGIDVIHMIAEEFPIDLTKPILSQRRVGRFQSRECKQLLSKKPVRWLPGLHSSNYPPLIDSKLFIFHLKLMDYTAATLRQKVNLETAWSVDSVTKNFGAHHRFTVNQFVRNSFLVPLDLYNRKQVGDFEFSSEIQSIKDATTVDKDGNYRIPMNISKLVEIPERFRMVF